MNIPAALISASLAATLVAADLPEWPQFGGPHRNFMTDSTGLAAQWSAAGPPQLWSRALGEGYSGIAVDHGMLYTMYRNGADEVVIALDAATGRPAGSILTPRP
jgi:outer membrane protein assembly factor BamB